MALQLKILYNLVKEKCSDKIELIAGQNGLDNTVRWINIVEGVEMSHFLEGNEITFTTGIALKDENELYKLVQAAYIHDVSGIVINVGSYISNIPQNVINFCDEKSLPLFKLPWQARISYVMKFFAEELTNSDKRSIELASAVKNAIYFSNNYDLYVPTMERYGYDTEGAYCIAVCECTDKNGEVLAINELEDIKINIENTITKLMPNVIIFCEKHKIVIAFSNTEERRIQEIVDSAVRTLPRSLREKINIFIGIGKNTNNIRCISKTFNIASRVAKLQRKRMAEGETTSYHNLGISQLFLSMDDMEIMREFYEKKLEPLVKYDEENNTDLLGFLQVYFSYGGRVGETASKLYLHRNSINYKLRKIEEILNCDFNDINSKAELLIAVKLMEIL